MKLPFLDREAESARLRRFFGRPEASLAAVYGRRRTGKSRLLREVLPAERTVYYVADDRDASLQRVGLAQEIDRELPGFGRVLYPDWDALLQRWWYQAPAGSVLAIDEFPALVAQAPELPSLLQKRLDRQDTAGPHLVLTGSSQRMMLGLGLDRSAPLFGRAAEILRLLPLEAGWLRRALALEDDARVIESWAVWGGIPRYWELAADFPDLTRAVRELILSPLGVLHEEPATLLLDDLRETTQAASILSLVGRGCHRLSEIAGRLGKPATSLSRPMQRLLELGLVRRDLPWGTSTRDAKRTLYRIADPFLRFWFAFVEPERSRLEAGQVDAVALKIWGSFSHHVASHWEELVRASIPRGEWLGRRWKPAASWWGAGTDGKPVEFDVVAESEDETALLVGEVKWGMKADVARLTAELRARAARLPTTAGRTLCLGLWLERPPARSTGDGVGVVSPTEVLGYLGGDVASRE